METGLTLISQASVPMAYWDDASLTEIFLINRMFTYVLQLLSPFEKLFIVPHITLRVLGCACSPIYGHIIRINCITAFRSVAFWLRHHIKGIIVLIFLGHIHVS